MQAIVYTTTTSGNETIIGYTDETHIVVNHISNSVTLMFKDEQLSRQLEYPSLEEALVAGQAILNLQDAKIWSH